MGLTLLRITILSAACLAASACGRGSVQQSQPPSDSLLIGTFNDHRKEFALLQAQAKVDMKRCKKKPKKTNRYRELEAADKKLAEAQDDLEKKEHALTIAKETGHAVEAAEKAVKEATDARDAATAVQALAAENYKTPCDLSFDMTTAATFAEREPYSFLGSEQIEAYLHLTKGAGLSRTKIEADKDGVTIIAYEASTISGSLRKGFYYTERDLEQTFNSLDVSLSGGRTGGQKAVQQRRHRLIESARTKKKNGEFSYKNWYIFWSHG